MGLNTGSLRIYRVNETTEDDEQPPQTGEQTGEQTGSDGPEPLAPKVKPVDLLREEDKFSRRPVQQLAIIKEASILLSLSDNHVSVYDLQTYALQEKLERTRGATTFAVTSNIVKDPDTGIPTIMSRLAVAVKRKIILWTWQDMELSGDAAEITLVASAKSLTWATGTKIVAGMDPGFVMVNVESQEIQDIVKPNPLGEAGAPGSTRFGAVSSSGMGYMGMGSWVPKPLATRLQEGEMLLAKDVNSLFIDSDGNALDKRQVPWPSAPESLAYSYPYMLSLQPPAKGGLEIRNPDTLNLLQTIALPNANFLHVPQPNISLAHAGKGFLVGSDRCIWRMGAQSYESQIDELVANGRFDEALSLLNMLEDTLLLDKEDRIREIMMLKAGALFELRKFREAMDLFTDAKAPPERVIALYPKSIAGNYSSVESVKDDESVVDEDERTNGDKAPTESKETPSTAVNTIGRSMMGRLVGHKKVDSDTASLRSSLNTSKEDTTDATSIKGKTSETILPDNSLEGKDLKLAVHALQSYLAQCRVQIKRYIDIDGTLKEPLPQQSESQAEEFKPPFHCFIQTTTPLTHVDWAAELLKAAQLVDTTLFRAYMLASPGLAGPLFRLPNFCEPGVVQEKLYETGRYADLIDFLHGKRLHRQALELLAKFGKNEAHDEVSSSLQGPQRTVGYLQQLPPEMIDLILEFAEWPLRTDPKLGMEVFLADTENAETLPRHQVLEFLEKIDTGLAVKYLEHIIEELNDLTPDFHQKLVDLFLERLRAHDFSDDEEKQRWRDRLQTFLKTSTNYNTMRVFRQLPADDADYYEARAVVLSKMGNHKQALQIYVFDMKDYAKAEEYAFPPPLPSAIQLTPNRYCNNIYLSTVPASPTIHSPSFHPSFTSTPPIQPSVDAPTEPSIYHTLLSLYLAPPHPHAPNWPPALALLSRHGARLPANTTLDLVPPSLPVKDLESYFRGRIRSANSLLNSERIVARLRGVEKVEVEAAVLLGEGNSVDGKGRKVPGGLNRRVVITEERHCAVCHKRFGGSAIRVYADGGVVHSGCLRGSVGRKRGETQREGMGWR